MVRRLATVALIAAVATPIAAHASPKDLAIHVSVPGLSVTYVDPGFRLAAPVHRPLPVYAPVGAYLAPGYGPPTAYAPIYRPANPVVVHYGHGYRGHWAHPGHRHPHHHGHPGRHGHDGHRGHWR